VHQAHSTDPHGTVTRIQLRIIPLRVGVRRVQALLSGGPMGSRLLDGWLDDHETISHAARRTSQEQLGLTGTPLQVAAMGSPHEGIQVIYALAVRPPEPGSRLPTSHLAGSTWRSAWEPGQLMDGERDVLDMAIGAVASRVEHEEAGFLFVHSEFTVTELRRVHECFLRTRIDPSNFRKRVGRWVDEQRVIELSKRRPTATRPARLYTRTNL